MIKFKNLIEAINEAAIAANSTVFEAYQTILEDYFVTEENDRLKAKTVTIDYPIVVSDNKVKTVQVHVPLITLVPISSAKVASMKFNTEVEIVLDNDELMVGFPHKKKENIEEDTSWFKEKPKGVSQLELVIEPTEASEGLHKIIEGYEKVLRSQIPG